MEKEIVMKARCKCYQTGDGVLHLVCRKHIADGGISGFRYPVGS